MEWVGVADRKEVYAKHTPTILEVAIRAGGGQIFIDPKKVPTT